MDPITQVTRDVLARVVYLHKLREIIAIHYTLTANPSDRVRVSAVADTVAKALDVASSPQLRADVRMAAHWLGITKVVTSSNVDRYTGVLARV